MYDLDVVQSYHPLYKSAANQATLPGACVATVCNSKYLQLQRGFNFLLYNVQAEYYGLTKVRLHPASCRWDWWQGIAFPLTVW